MKIILGIGNPGKQYENTRHNIGFMLIDELAKRAGVFCDEKKWDSLCTTAVIGGEKVLLMKPQTYVNASGLALQRFVSFYKIDMEDVLVVVDDIHLKPGDLRLRAQGSHGGHNGLRDIERLLGKNYARLRMGIGQSQFGASAQVDHVLGAFTAEEQENLTKQIVKAADACTAWLDQGVEGAMRFNGPLVAPPPRPKKKTQELKQEAQVEANQQQQLAKSERPEGEPEK